MEICLNPLISVIIPVRNCQQHIIGCLEQLRSQSYPHNLIEVIVVDGASIDNTALLAAAFEWDGGAVNVLRIQVTGRAAGLNAAIKAANGGAYCRLDVRTRIGSEYIRLCVESLLRSGAANVGGLQVPNGVTLTQRAIGWAMSHPFGAGNAQFRVAKESGYVDTIYPGFFRSDIFDKVGMFDERPGIISEDSDFNQRIRTAGERIFLDVNIQAGYEPRATVWEHAVLYFRYGVARAGNLRKHGNFTSWRQLAAPTLVAGILVLTGLGAFYPEILFVLVAIIGAYVCVDLAISSALVMKHRCWAALLVLILVFPVMHFGWGLGFWRGILSPPERDDQLKV